MKKQSSLFEGGSKEEQRKKKTLFFVICATLSLLAVLLVTLLGSFAVSKIVDMVSKDTDQDDETPQVSIGETQTITIDPSNVYSGDLLILNDSHVCNDAPSVESIQKSETRPKLEDGKTNSYTVWQQNTKLCATEEAINAFNKMAGDFYAKTKNDNLIVYDAYNPDKSSQSPVFTAGTAIELWHFIAVDNDGNIDGKQPISKTTTDNLNNFSWIYSNAAKYGFVNVAVDGKASNIFRYVGVEHSYAMINKKLSFDAYINWLKTNTSPTSPLASKNGSSSYAIYYLAADAEHIVPTSYEYTVSGNNMDGYIITVKISG